MSNQLSPLPIQHFTAPDGSPAYQYRLFTYIAGTSTKLGTFSDSSGSANTNPITLNARGECALWLDSTKAYKFIFTYPGSDDPPTNPIWTVDNITTANAIGSNNYAADTGTANNYVATFAPITALSVGLVISVKIAHTNTGASTLNLNSLGAKPIVLLNNNALVGGELQINGIYQFEYDGTSWQAITQAPSYPQTAAEAAASVTPINYAYQPRPWLDIKREGCVLDGSTDDYAAFNRCVSVAASTNTGMVIDGPMRIGTNITVPANVFLLFVGAGQLVPDVAKTITFNGVIQASPSQQIIAGSGSVLLSNTTNPEIWANWFPGSDIGAKINAAKTSCGGTGPVTIRVAPANYNYSTLIDFTNTQSIRLTGPGYNCNTLNNPNPNLVWTGGAGSGSALKAPGAIGFELDRLTLTYSNAAYNGQFISLSSTGGAADTTSPHVHHCSITGTSGSTAAASLIELNITEDACIEHNSFRYAATYIKATGASCNGITISRNWFQSECTSSKISAQGNAWTIEKNIDENGTNIIALLDLQGDLQGTVIKGNQSVDGGAGGGTMIDLHGASHVKGMEISGNSFTAASGTAILFSSTSGNTSGVDIRANYIATPTGINLAAGDNISVHANNLSGCTTPWTGSGPTRMNFGENDLGTTTTSGIPVTDTSTIALSRTTAKGSGVIEVYSIEDNAQAIYMLNGTGNSVNEIADPAGIFTPTAGSAASVNIYYSAGNARYELENKRGATRTFVINTRFGR